MIDKRFLAYSYSCAFREFSVFLKKQKEKFFECGPVIDLGSGTGVHANLFNVTYVAVDSSFSLLKSGTTGKKEFFVAADITRLPFKDNAFSSFVCRSVLEHLKNPDAAIREAHRVCQKGGIIEVPERDKVPFLYDPVNFFRRNKNMQLAKFGIGAYGHINVLKSNQWRELFEGTGFNVGDFRPIGRRVIAQIEMLLVNIVFAGKEYEELPHGHTSVKLWKLASFFHRLADMFPLQSKGHVTCAYLLKKR